MNFKKKIPSLKGNNPDLKLELSCCKLKFTGWHQIRNLLSCCKFCKTILTGSWTLCSCVKHIQTAM